MTNTDNAYTFTTKQAIREIAAFVAANREAPGHARVSDAIATITNVIERIEDAISFGNKDYEG